MLVITANTLRQQLTNTEGKDCRFSLKKENMDTFGNHILIIYKTLCLNLLVSPALPLKF